ncbi:hypothetical protein [Porphyrobacter sp. GA68]|uniref:hypothetical protein n=1 Tax=Porphyrobacter sp. GA68 TaxID=2883480 RepID=UPI001D186D00|nr:hypothetical protein [Porphyrobacter sp. GA68]
MSDELKQLKALLWEEWDPIGVNNGSGGPTDEYDSYALKLYSMLQSNASRDEVLNYLVWVRTEYIGIGEKGDPPIEADWIVADKAMRIHKEAQ